MRWCRNDGDLWTTGRGGKIDKERKKEANRLVWVSLAQAKTVVGFVIHTGTLSLSSAQLQSPKNSLHPSIFLIL
jgi:hypothetical protein